MGDTTSIESENIMDKIEFFQHSEDSFFGKIDIYKFKEPPYEYVIDYKKNYVDNKQRISKDEALMNQLKNIEHPNLAKIYYCQQVEDAQLCIKHQVLHTYTNYYNFTLKQAIKKKKLTKHVFSEGDLLYIAKSLVDLAAELKKYGISKGAYRSQEIFLSPEGYVKLYLLEIEPENRHSCYYTVLSEKQRLSEFLLAPQQLQSLKKLQLQARFNQFKADVFAIGLVILELMTLDSAKFYYNFEMLEVMSAKINFLLDTYNSTRYSQNFLDIIKAMLEPDPAKRIEMERANEELNNLYCSSKTKTFCIRLQSDPNQSSQQTVEVPKIRKLGGLSHLSNRLTPTPISMLSSVSSSRPMISTRTSIKRMSDQL